jgi:hypothetical protein
MPVNELSAYKTLIHTIYREICNELGAVGIQDDTIMTRIFNLLTNIRQHLIAHTHSGFNFVIPGITIDDFEFTDEEKGISRD